MFFFNTPINIDGHSKTATLFACLALMTHQNRRSRFPEFSAPFSPRFPPFLATDCTLCQCYAHQPWQNVNFSQCLCHFSQSFSHSASRHCRDEEGARYLVCKIADSGILHVRICAICMWGYSRLPPYTPHIFPHFATANSKPYYLHSCVCIAAADAVNNKFPLEPQQICKKGKTSWLARRHVFRGMLGKIGWKMGEKSGAGRKHISALPKTRRRLRKRKEIAARH